MFLTFVWIILSDSEQIVKITYILKMYDLILTQMLTGGKCWHPRTHCDEREMFMSDNTFMHVIRWVVATVTRKWLS